ncbi:unnamed protein product, partial [Closterium sp. Yama58-4]
CFPRLCPMPLLCRLTALLLNSSGESMISPNLMFLALGSMCPSGEQHSSLQHTAWQAAEARENIHARSGCTQYARTSLFVLFVFHSDNSARSGSGGSKPSGHHGLRKNMKSVGNVAFTGWAEAVQACDGKEHDQCSC